jgi:hypothetical protein
MRLCDDTELITELYRRNLMVLKNLNFLIFHKLKSTCLFKKYDEYIYLIT